MRIERKKEIEVDGSCLQVLKIALPLVLSSSCHAVNMFMDRLMLARYSANAVAAAFTGGLTHFTLSCLFVGTIGYTGTFVAQYGGARRYDRIGPTVWQGIWLAVLGGLLMTTGVWWCRPLFHLFRHTPDITAQEIAYFQVLCQGGVILLAGCGIAGFWSGRGRTGTVLLVSILMTVLNLPLNYLLIFGRCGFPELGVRGAAWGTVLAESIGLLIYFVLLLLPASRRHFRTDIFRPDFTMLKRILRYGLVNGIQLTLDLLSFNIFSLLLGCYGPAVHEAAGITFGVNNIAFCPVMGVGITASILAGQGAGAGKPEAVRRAVRSCLLIVEIYTLAMILLFTFGQDLLLYPFLRPGDLNQAATVEYARVMFYFISAYLAFDGVNITFSNMLRGAGDTDFTMYTMLLASMLLFALPCCVFFLLEQPWWTLWLAMDIYLAVLSLVFYVRYREGKWTGMRVIETTALEN